MKKAPSWLVELVTRSCPAGPNLWVGPSLVFPDALGVCRWEQGPPPVAATSYAGVWVARAEGDLASVLRRLRPLCEPGAVLGLLLPQPGGGLREVLRGLLGPLGREGRTPRSLTEQCGALLACGVQGIEVVQPLTGPALVAARMPERTSGLDGEWTAALD